MPFLSPLALAGLLFIPAVIAMYLLKLRRDETVVSSTLLWQRLVTDVEANAPWQRLRRSLLLLLQLLLVLALALLAARPFLERPAGLARDLVIVVDASASMAATDVVPNRLEMAKAAAIEALRDLPAGGTVSVIAAGRTARIVANPTSDLGRARAAIESVQVAAAPGNLDDALRLAAALAARSNDAEILVATDAALAGRPTATVRAPIRVLQVGRDRKNQAIVALSVRPSPSSVTRSVFVGVANLALEPAQRRLELWGDGALVEARDLFLEPQARANVVIDDLPAAIGVVEARLVGGDSGPDGTGDQLAIDDRAWAIVPDSRDREILLVSAGDPYLETALTYLPNSIVYEVAPGDYPTKARRTNGTEWDLIIFEGNLPAELPRTAILAIDPPRTSPLGDVVGTLKTPSAGLIDAAEPILRYVDLSTLHIAAAQRLVLPDWARTVIPGPGGAPLLYVGERAGLETAVLAFDLRQSDLPLQVAFPILLANLTGELLGGSGAPAEALRPGDPVNLSIPAGATGLRVQRPDGSTVDIVPGVVGGAAATFSQTDQLGVYFVEPIAGPAPGSSDDPSASPGPTATPSASPTSSGTPGPGASPEPPPAGPIRFAVDLFDVDESNIAPGQASQIEALGGVASPAPSNGPSASGPPTPSGATASPTPGGGAGGVVDEPRAPARDELWGPLLLLVLGLLLAEWIVYQRDALTRGRRALAARLGRPDPATAGRPAGSGGR